jgi:hypothetical protein
MASQMMTFGRRGRMTYGVLASARGPLSAQVWAGGFWLFGLDARARRVQGEVGARVRGVLSGCVCVLGVREVCCVCEDGLHRVQGQRAALARGLRATRRGRGDRVRDEHR